MNRRAFLRAAGAGLLAMSLSDLQANQKRLPNLIIIFADDQGYGDLGCFGARTIKTPHIDRMAREGRRFTDFYVAAPLCTPSRAALMTGRYPIRTGLARGVLRPDAKQGLPLEEVTIAETLKKAGYATACLGKWHLGFVDNFRPTRRGFDDYFGLYHNLDEPEAKHFEGKGGVPVIRNEEVAIRPAQPETLTELYTEEAIGFIERNKDKPFFLYLAHTMPHVPLGASPRFKGKSAAGLYGDVIECLDWSTGRILDKIRQLGLAEDTLVVYTSDNGPSPRATGSAAPLRGRKHQVYEGGMRVPCVIWSPGRVPAGSVCRELTTTMDLLPTFAKMAGASTAASRSLDGKDISDLITGQPGAKSPHQAFFFHDGKGKLRAVRSGPWKLHLADKPELYDLSRDIAESQNLAQKNPNVVTRLRELAAQFKG